MGPHVPRFGRALRKVRPRSWLVERWSLWLPAGAALLAVICALVLGAPASAVRGVALHGRISVSKEGSGSGTVTSSPPGIDCGDTCFFPFPSQAQEGFQPVTLTASADPGSEFAGWGGACSGSGSCTISEIRELVVYEVSARFDPVRASSFSLAVSTSGSGTVTSSPSGVSCGTACTASFAAGAAVTLTATPTPGWSFSGWGGSCSGNQPTCSVTMDGPKSATATFAPPETVFPVAVVTAGGGTVTSDLPGIDCGVRCDGAFGSGVRVVLNAAGPPPSWVGACSGSESTCTLTMDGPKAVTASFAGAALSRYPVAVAVRGKGSVKGDAGGIDCSPACATSYPAGMTVGLVAAAAEGWRFSGWSGACQGVPTTCRVTASAPLAAVATFVEAGTRFPLAVTTLGQGVVRSTPTGVSCRPSCSAQFLAGTAVLLRARPAKGSKLVRWSGACSGSRQTCSVGMDGAKSVSVTFARNADQVAPSVTALPSTGARGQLARLRYRVRDASGRSREWANVFRMKRRLATVRGPLDEADPRVLYSFLRWRVPRSKPSCARLRIA